MEKNYTENSLKKSISIDFNKLEIFTEWFKKFQDHLCDLQNLDTWKSDLECLFYYITCLKSKSFNKSNIQLYKKEKNNTSNSYPLPEELDFDDILKLISKYKFKIKINKPNHFLHKSFIYIDKIFLEKKENNKTTKILIGFKICIETTNIKKKNTAGCGIF